MGVVGAVPLEAIADDVLVVVDLADVGADGDGLGVLVDVADEGHGLRIAHDPEGDVAVAVGQRVRAVDDLAILVGQPADLERVLDHRPHRRGPDVVLGVAVDVADPATRADGVALGHQHREGDVAGRAFREVPASELDRFVAGVGDLRARAHGLADARWAGLLVGAGGEGAEGQGQDQGAHGCLRDARLSQTLPELGTSLWVP